MGATRHTRHARQYGLRRQAQRDAALDRQAKALSPLRSASALQMLRLVTFSQLFRFDSAMVSQLRGLTP